MNGHGTTYLDLDPLLLTHAPVAALPASTTYIGPHGQRIATPLATPNASALGVATPPPISAPLLGVELPLPTASPEPASTPADEVPEWMREVPPPAIARATPAVSVDARDGAHYAAPTPPQAAPQAAPQPQVLAAQPEVMRARKSPFRSNRDFCAGHITIDDTTYWYREISDPTREWMERAYTQIAQRLGLTSEAFLSDDYTGAKPEELAKLPQYIDQAYSQVLVACLVDWDASDERGQRVPLTLPYVADLGTEVKAELLAQVQRSTQFGISFAAFRRQRG